MAQLTTSQDYSVNVTFLGTAHTLHDVVRQLDVVDRSWVAALLAASYRYGHDPLVMQRPGGMRGPTPVANVNIGRPPGGPLRRGRVPRPTIVHVIRRSPTWLELAGQIAVPGSVAAASLSLFVYMLKNPKNVSALLPRLLAGWREGLTEAEDAKRNLAISRALTAEKMMSAGDLHGFFPDLQWLAIDITADLQEVGPIDVAQHGVAESLPDDFRAT